MNHNFYISSAGVAGDPHKLVVLELSGGSKFFQLFNSKSLRSLRRAKKKLRKEAELVTGARYE